MIDIVHNKLYSRNCEEEYLCDGSVRLVKYIAPPKSAPELVTLTKSYYNSDYTLHVNTPPQRKPDAVIICSHTSANNWRLIVCTLFSVSVHNLNTLNEVNEVLHGLLDK